MAAVSRTRGTQSPASTILSATRRFARTRRSSPWGQLRYNNPHGYISSTPPFTATTGTTFTIASAPTFIDPTARIVNGYAVIVSSPGFIGPYSTLNAHGGIIKIGIGSVILDNASIVANPLHPHTAPAPEVKIGNQVIIGYGAQVLGPSTIGAYGSAAAPTGIGPGAVIDQATIAPGAYVSALARVGPGITIPTGKLVLPGADRDERRGSQEPHQGRDDQGQHL